MPGLEIKVDLLLKAIGVLLLMVAAMVGWYLQDISDRLAAIEQTTRGLARAVEIGAGGE